MTERDRRYDAEVDQALDQAAVSVHDDYDVGFYRAGRAVAEFHRYLASIGSSLGGQTADHAEIAAAVEAALERQP